MRKRMSVHLTPLQYDQLEVLAITRGLTKSATLGEMVRDQFRAAYANLMPADAVAMAERLATSARYIARADGVKIRKGNRR